MSQHDDVNVMAQRKRGRDLQRETPAEDYQNRYGWQRLLLLVGEGLLLVVVSFFVSLAVIDFLGLLKPFRIGPTAYKVKIQEPDVETSAPLGEAVFFPNGESVLSIDANKSLTVIAKLTECSGATLKITPWVSSAEYKNDPDGTKNVALAKRRGQAVSDFLVNKNRSIHILGKDWGSFSEIRGRLLFNDLRSNPRQESEQEEFNRRVDIRVEKGCGDVAATLAMQ